MSNATVDVEKPNPVRSNYFERVICQMEKGGYQLFSQVAIDSNDCPYHVPATYARDTRLFFRLPEKKLIVKLVFNESDYHTPGKLDCYWTIRLYPVFKSYAKLFDMTYRSEMALDLEDKDPTDNIPLFRKAVNLPGFRNRHNYTWEQQGSYGVLPLDPEQMVRSLVRALYPATRYIAFGQFKELQVTDFPPHYTFPGSPKIFWERFDNEAFSQIVIRPWGSER